MRWIGPGLIALSVAVASATALVAQPSAQRLSGTIEKVEGKTLTLKVGGAVQTLTLADGARVIAVVKASMADIKPGTFLGSAAMPQPDGSQKALEVHIFPEEMRGTGEGHRPFRLPNSTMTNGTAAGDTVTGVDGATLLVKYKGGEKKIVVPPGVPIVRYLIGGNDDLKAGAHFTVLRAVKKADGSFEADRINVGRDGVVPQ